MQTLDELIVTAERTQAAAAAPTKASIDSFQPQSIISHVDMGLALILKAEYCEVAEEETAGMPEFTTQEQLDAYIVKLENEMRAAARKFEFEKAGRLRDTIKDLRDKEFLFG